MAEVKERTEDFYLGCETKYMKEILEFFGIDYTVEKSTDTVITADRFKWMADDETNTAIIYAFGVKVRMNK